LSRLGSRIVLGVALVLASTPTLMPTVVAAANVAPLSEETRARVEALYSAAAEALDEGDPAAAAASYAEVLDAIQEDAATHGGRALALADALGAYRAAYAEGSAHEHLCAAQALLTAYTKGLDELYGDAVAQLDGAALAAQEEESLALLLADENMSCETDTEVAPDPEAAPEPEPEVAASPEDPPPSGPSVDGRSRPSPWVIGGAAGVSFGGVLLGVMAGGLVAGARASGDAAALREGMPSLTVDDPELGAVLRRGQRSDRVATITGVGAGVALVTGAILFVVARTHAQRRAAGRRGEARRFGIGRGFVVRFGAPRRLQSPRR